MFRDQFAFWWRTGDLEKTPSDITGHHSTWLSWVLDFKPSNLAWMLVSWILQLLASFKIYEVDSNLLRDQKTAFPSVELAAVVSLYPGLVFLLVWAI